MAVMIEVDEEDSIELSEDHATRVTELSKMFLALLFSVCEETDTNFCELSVDLTRQMAGNMILNGHAKCARGLRKEIDEAIAFLSEKAGKETAH